MRRIIFLDIDGVLNSMRYDRERTAVDGNIDESRLPLLKRLTDATSAEIVLSSSWRKHWSREVERMDAIGAELNRVFGKYGLSIWDKTPALPTHDRAQEILAWLQAYGHEVEAYVIFDDEFGGWGELSEHLIQTNTRIGRGLEESHIQRAIAHLSREDQ